MRFKHFVTELSKKTLQQYQDKAWFQDAGSGLKLNTKKDIKRYFNRKQGMKRARARLVS